MMLKAAYEDELKNFLSTPEELASDYYETFKAALLGRYREEQDILDIIWQAVKHAAYDEENDDKECLLQWKKYLEKAEVYVFLQQLLTLAAEAWEEESENLPEKLQREQAKEATDKLKEELEWRREVKEVLSRDLHCVITSVGGGLPKLLQNEPSMDDGEAGIYEFLDYVFNQQQDLGSVVTYCRYIWCGNRAEKSDQLTARVGIG